MTHNATVFPQRCCCCCCCSLVVLVTPVTPRTLQMFTELVRQPPRGAGDGVRGYMGRWEKKHRPPPPPPPSSCAKVNLILSCNQRVTLMKPQQAQHLIRVKSKLTLKIFAHIPPFLTHTLWIQWSRTSIHLAKGGGGVFRLKSIPLAVANVPLTSMSSDSGV